MTAAIRASSLRSIALRSEVTLTGFDVILGQLHLLQTPNSVNNTRTRLGGGKQSPRLDGITWKADPLLAAEQREQHLDPLMRLHAGVDPKLSSERPDRDLHARAHARTAGVGEFNQPVTLA